MPSRDFRPTLFSSDEALWRSLCIAAFLGSIGLMAWLNQTEPEPSDWSSEAWTDLPIPINAQVHTQAPLQVSLEQDTAEPLIWQLQQQAERGKVRPVLLLETFMEQEEAHGGGDSKLLQEEFLRQIGPEVSYIEPIGQLAELKARMMVDPELVYASNAFSFTEVLVSKRLQCQSSTMLIALAWLQQKTTQWPGGPRPVLVMSPNHVQPGLLHDGVLHLMEGTSRGNRVARLYLAQLGDVRVLDAADALTWALLQDKTPELIKDRMLLFDNHEGPLAWRRGSGGDGWLHIPLNFGGPIVLSSTPSKLPNNADPAKGVLSENCCAQELPVEEVGSLDSSLADFEAHPMPIALGTRMELTCPCLKDGIDTQGRDPCEGRRRKPSGEICEPPSG